MLVEAAFSELAVERFHEGVLRRLTRLDEVQLDVVVSGPKEHRFAGELGAVVTDDGLRWWATQLAYESRQARYKIPREVAILDDLPRNAAGKILKTPLGEL